MVTIILAFIFWVLCCGTEAHLVVLRIYSWICGQGPFLERLRTTWEFGDRTQVSCIQGKWVIPYPLYYNSGPMFMVLMYKMTASSIPTKCPRPSTTILIFPLVLHFSPYSYTACYSRFCNQSLRICSHLIIYIPLFI